MKILAIQGSPRRDGNTQAVLDLVLAAAGQTGAETDVVHLAEMKNLSGCIECKACQKTRDQPACALNDDMQAVYARVLDSDLLVWATPVFCWSPSWLSKMAMDRIYCMFKFREDGGLDSLIEGKRQAAVITAGGGEDDGADLVTETCRRLAEFSKCSWLGSLVAANVVSPQQIRATAELVERAREFGNRLAR